MDMAHRLTATVRESNSLVIRFGITPTVYNPHHGLPTVVFIGNHRIQRCFLYEKQRWVQWKNIHQQRFTGCFGIFSVNPRLSSVLWFVKEIGLSAESPLHPILPFTRDSCRIVWHFCECLL
jgi:hypothetical protein